MSNKKETLEEIEKRLCDAETIYDIIDVTDHMHPSDCYVVIKNIIDNNYKMKKIIQDAKSSDVVSYQTYQSIKMEARDSHNHDNTMAKMIDVDKAVSRAYNILLRMLGVMNQSLIKQGEAINKIEEHLKLDVTNFNGGDGDDTEHEDVQRD